MSPILILNCKIKVASSIGMIIFGLALGALGVFLSFKIGTWWWLILSFFGLFCIYTWGKILYKGSMTMVFFVREQQLYFTYSQTKLVLSRLDEIKDTSYFTEVYNLDEIHRFWRYILTVNGGVTTDNLQLVYKGKQVVLADLNAHEVALSDKDLREIAEFFIGHQPAIAIGKA